MSITLRPAESSDAQIWDSYVESHEDASPYHKFAWLQSVCSAYQHDNASYLIFDDDQLVGVIPLIRFKGLFGKYKFCSLPFCDVGYMLTSSQEARQKASKYLQTLSHTHLIEYRDANKSLTEEGDDAQLTNSKVRMLLDLPESSEALMKGFKSKLRSQIRKAEKNGLHSQVGHNRQLLNQFYQVFAENMRKLGSPVHSYQWFEELSKSYGDSMIMAVVYKDEQPVGGAIVLTCGSTASIPWASTLAEYNRLAPNMLLYWSVLAHTTDTGIKQFDFGRSTFNEGTFKFKQQWGAKATLLDWRLPHQQNSEKKLAEFEGKKGTVRQLIEKTWPKLPLRTTVWLGPKIRKHISL